MFKKILGVTLGAMLASTSFATPFGYKDFSDAKEGDINLMGPTGWLHQGEVEDYKVTLTKKIVQVPESSGLLLLLTGLALLVFRKKRSTK